MQAILLRTRCVFEPLDLGETHRDCCHVPEARLRPVTKLNGVQRVGHGHRSVCSMAENALGHMETG